MSYFSDIYGTGFLVPNFGARPAWGYRLQIEKMKLVLKLIAALVLVGSAAWLYVDRNFEPAIVFVGALGSLIALFVNEEDRISNSIEKKKARDALYKNTLHRIQKETPNFKRILETRSYSSHLHRRAVEQYSFELVLEEILKLKKIWRFRRLSKAIIEEINQTKNSESKNTTQLLKLLVKLESRLLKKCKINN